VEFGKYQTREMHVQIAHTDRKCAFVRKEIYVDAVYLNSLQVRENKIFTQLFTYDRKLGDIMHGVVSIISSDSCIG
jgi:hypothetical protein